MSTNTLLEPGKVYHIYNHAIGDENLFRNDNNFTYFLKKYASYIFPICKTYAYCLMPNHFHFMVRINEEDELQKHFEVLRKAKNERQLNKNVVPKMIEEKQLDYPDFIMQQFQNMFNGYAQAYNKMYDRRGALFMDFVRRKEITNEKYFSRLVYYIHQNPIHHQFCKDLNDWKYTSYHAFLSDKNTKLNKEEVLEWFGGIDWFKQFHEKEPEILMVKEFGF